MQNEFKILKASFEKYTKTNKELLQQRKLIDKSNFRLLKKLIKNVVAEVIHEKVEIYNENSIKNFEIFSIELDDEETQYQKVEGEDFINIIKTGATLNFQPTLDGSIKCWMTFPSIEGLKSNFPDLVIKGDIQKEDIHNHTLINLFKIFFDKLIDWEKS